MIVYIPSTEHFSAKEAYIASATIRHRIKHLERLADRSGTFIDWVFAALIVTAVGIMLTVLVLALLLLHQYSPLLVLVQPLALVHISWGAIMAAFLLPMLNRNIEEKILVKRDAALLEAYTSGTAILLGDLLSLDFVLRTNLQKRRIISEHVDELKPLIKALNAAEGKDKAAVEGRLLSKIDELAEKEVCAK